MVHKSDEDVLNEQTSEEIIEIDENGVVHAEGKTAEDLKKTGGAPASDHLTSFAERISRDELWKRNGHRWPG